MPKPALLLRGVVGDVWPTAGDGDAVAEVAVGGVALDHVAVGIGLPERVDGLALDGDAGRPGVVGEVVEDLVAEAALDAMPRAGWRVGVVALDDVAVRAASSTPLGLKRTSLPIDACRRGRCSARCRRRRRGGRCCRRRRCRRSRRSIDAGVAGGGHHVALDAGCGASRRLRITPASPVSAIVLPTITLSVAASSKMPPSLSSAGRRRAADRVALDAVVAGVPQVHGHADVADERVVDDQCCPRSR